MVEISPHLNQLYRDYFDTDSIGDQERALAAIESVRAIRKLDACALGSLLDVGAGDGVVAVEIDRNKLATSITAVELSQSGIDRIKARSFDVPVTVQKIDGYLLPYSDGAFDTAVCSHVIEHIEHERVFLGEVGRVANQLFLIAPLEGCLRGRVDRRMGHINYYSPLSLANLVETSGFEIIGKSVFTASLEREQAISGRFAGTIKNALRRSLSAVLGEIAPHFMTHMMAIRAVPQRTLLSST